MLLSTGSFLVSQCRLELKSRRQLNSSLQPSEKFQCTMSAFEVNIEHFFILSSEPERRCLISMLTAELVNNTFEVPAVNSLLQLSCFIGKTDQSTSDPPKRMISLLW